MEDSRVKRDRDQRGGWMTRLQEEREGCEGQGGWKFKKGVLGRGSGRK